MKNRNLFLCFAFLIFFFSETLAQQSSGTLVVKVSPDALKGEGKFRIQLVEKSSRVLVQEAKVGATDEIIIHDVPFASYYVRLFDGNSVISTGTVTINSSVPQHLELAGLRKVEAGEIIVEGSKGDVEPGAHTYYSSRQIENLPAASSPKKMEAIILNTPGAVPDEDGRMHFRGEDAQLQYVIDGIPVTTNSSRIYSSLFNASLIKSVDIQRGGLPAEYGVATSAVVSINTRSGFDAPVFAEGSASIGSFGTMVRTLSIGGNIDGRVALFAGYSSSETDRYLDPIKSFDPNHTDGYTHNYFAKADFLLSDNIDIVILGTRNLANFGIANGGKTGLRTLQLPAPPEQDQRQNLSDYMFAARLNATLGDNSALSILGYKRQTEAMNTSGGLMQINSAADSIKAVQENEDFFIGAHRIDEVIGGQVEFSAVTKWFSVPNALKFGVGGESYPLQEFFTFAVTNPDKSNPALPGGDDRLIPYDLTQGGHPFLVNQSKTGTRFSVYAQDHLTLQDWIIDAGLRYDMFKLLADESGISPRLSAAYHLTSDLWLKASYNRIIMQAPVENILVSSSDEAKILVGTEQGSTPTSVMSEKEHVVEIGASYKLNENIDIDLNGYGKFIDNYIVKVELGVSGVIFPVNLKQGRVLGGELEVRLHDWNNFSGTLSFATCDARGLKPSDGSSPIAGGLIIGEEGENYNKPFAGEDAFQTEHNQALTASFTLNYAHPSGFFSTLGGRFDSGLPFDIADSNGVGLDEAQSKAELKRRGYSDDIINLLNLAVDKPGSPDKSSASHFILDLSAGFDFNKTLGVPAKISGTILNVLDTKYLYKFESVFGGTHFGLPRMYVLQLQVKI